MKFWRLFFLMPTFAAATASFQANLTDLFNRSDLVCRGKFVSQSRLIPWTGSGRLAPSDWTARFNAKTCYKGDASGKSLDLFLPSVDPAWGAPFSLGEGVIVFLKTRADGTQIFTDPVSVLQFADVPPEARSGEPGIAQLEKDLIGIATKGAVADSKIALETLLLFPRL